MVCWLKMNPDSLLSPVFLRVFAVHFADIAVSKSDWYAYVLFLSNMVYLKQLSFKSMLN